VNHQRLKTYIAKEGIADGVNGKGFLAELVRKAGWSSEVTRFQSQKDKSPHHWELDVEFANAEPVVLPYCKGLSFQLNPALKQREADQKARLNLRMLRSPASADDGVRRMIVTVRGDLSVVLPEVGLIPVGRLVGTKGITSLQPDRLKLLPGLARISKQVTRFDEPLGRSILVVDDARDRIHVSPGLDLRGRIYEIGNTGVLVSFDRLSFSCQGSALHLDFRGGRFWRGGTNRD
jgi:hypothetical protein